MSSDLSKIIQETIESTLEINLSNAAPITDISKSSNESLLNTNIIIQEANFTFEHINANLKFIFPAYTASYIFNTIMMEESEPSLEINDDIADAIKEVTSQISGSLETSINANLYEDLGSCKFKISDPKLDIGDNYENSSNIIKLTITVEDKLLEFFVDFNDEFIPYIYELSSSMQEEIENLNIIEPVDDEKEELNEKIAENDEIEIEEIENKQENENTKNDEQVLVDKDDNKKIKIIIIVLASLIGLLIITIFVLFVTGSFDKSDIKNIKIKKIVLSKSEQQIKNIKNKKINFTPSMIDVVKLNRRLSILTKYDILEEDILNQYKNLEKERLHKLKMKKLEEFANQNKEENIFKKDLINNSKLKNRFDSNSSIINYSDINSNLKFAFIQLDALKYKKYKKLISREKTKNINISICKHNEKTYVYIGPLHLNLVINNIMRSIKKYDAKLIKINNFEFNKRCSF